MNPVKRILGKFRKKEAHPKARTYHGIASIRRRASPLYYAIRSFFRLVILTQHREIQAIGVENIPPDGSVMLVGNHPNSYLDYFHLLHAVRHPVATAAKDVITNWPIIGPILRKHMLMIPIARRQDQDITGTTEEERREANAKAVQETVEMLVQGRLYNIFGEGRSTDSRKLNKIKLGFMHIALQAEREFNYKLNLRIVPFGFFYDRINKFQSSAVIIFGKPFKLNNLVEMPEDFLALSISEQTALEKKIMIAGKKRMQSAIEDLIISIDDKNLIDLIDDASALYVLTPRKYMGPYKNIREKYYRSKLLSDCIQKANKEERGRALLEDLKKNLAIYRRDLTKYRLKDAIVRREHGWTELGHHLKSIFLGLLYSPLILYGKIFNFIPHRAGRLARYYVIEVQKRPKVDGDEQALTAATIFALLSYPIFGGLICYLLEHFGFAWIWSWFLEQGRLHRFSWMELVSLWGQKHTGLMAASLGALSVYLMARLWRFALRYGQDFKDALLWLRDSILELARNYEISQLRTLRYEIIDKIDYIVGEYDREDGNG